MSGFWFLFSKAKIKTSTSTRFALIYYETKITPIISICSTFHFFLNVPSKNRKKKLKKP